MPLVIGKASLTLKRRGEFLGSKSFYILEDEERVSEQEMKLSALNSVADQRDTFYAPEDIDFELNTEWY